MVLRLDPRLPLVWRSPRELQLGLDSAQVRLKDPTVAEERMISALAGGATRPMLESLAAGSRAPGALLDGLLGKLGSAVLEDTAAQSGPGWSASGEAPRIAVDGHGMTADALRRLFAELAASRDGEAGEAGNPVTARAGTDTAAAPDDPAEARDPVTARAGVDAAVVLGHFAIEPARYAHWLRWDVPHLPIVFSDASARVGPVVEPGSGPCLFCLDLERTDRDPDWPAMASQLVCRRAATETGLNVAAVVAVAGRMLWNRFRTPPPDAARVRPVGEPIPDTATSWSYLLDSETGILSRQSHRAHPDCACRGLPGIATGPGRAPDPTRSTSSAGGTAAHG